MTIDSQYAFSRQARHTGLIYPFEIESMGSDTLEVYKVINDPFLGFLQTQLLEGYHYSIEYEDQAEPIYVRGRVKFVAPIASDGVFILILRKTPNTNSFAAVAGEPFPSEALEYSLDKLCMIAQEIEGTACSCPDYPTFEGTPDVPSKYPGD